MTQIRICQVFNAILLENKTKTVLKMDRLKELRLERGLSRQQLAKQIETTQSNIGRWEN